MQGTTPGIQDVAQEADRKQHGQHSSMDWIHIGQ